MKRKFLIILLTLISMICFAVMFSACGDKGNVDNTGNNSSVTDQTGDSNDDGSGNNSETPETPKSPDGGSGTQNGNPQKPATHVHSYGNWEIISPATHTTAGTRRKYCSCGEHVDETIPKTTEHEYGNWKTTREATHLFAGEKQRTCLCGKVETEVIPKTTEHTFLPYSHKDATCTEAGEDVLRCECGAEKRNIISPSHTYDHCECTVCGAIKPGAIAVEVHVDDRLYDTVYTDAEYGYKIELPTVPPDWKVDKSILCYFDGWYTDKDFTTLATGQEVYRAPSAIYSRQFTNDKWGCECTFSNNEATITKVNLKIESTYATTIFIPRYINSFPVTGIADSAFKGQTTIRYIFLSDTIRTIGEGAFEGCNSMLKVFFSEGLTSIGSFAFYGCTGLTGVYITDLAAWCNIDFDHYYANPLYYANNLYLNDKPVTAITADMLQGFTEIKDYVFAGFGGTSITIPASVTYIGESAFCDCTGLESITIPDSVTIIGTWAFSGCAAEIKWGDKPSIQKIGIYAFSGYKGTSITIPDSVTSIGESVFYDCTSLESITLPFVGGSIKTENDTWQYPFGYIFGTSSYSGASATEQYNYRSSTSSTTKSTYYIPYSLKTVKITGGNILRGAFYGCTSLESITIPDGITSIGESAFYNCTNLESITIPDSVTSIGDYAFNGCTNLESITIPDSVTSIGDYAFNDCTSLKSITIPNSVTSIGKSAFYGCTSLTGVYVTYLAAWCNIEFGYDYYANPLCYAHKLYLNNELVTEITADMLQGVTEIKARAFYYCTSLTSITIPNSVTSIDSRAFYDCYGLESVNFGNNSKLETIDDYAFYYCTSLTSITIPDKVDVIGEYAFYDCYKLESVTIGSGVTLIASYAFAYCGLKSIEIPDNVKQLLTYSFYGSSLQSVTISSGVKNINQYSFGNCSKLESMIFESTSKWGLLDNSGTGDYRYTITVTNNTANNAKLFTNTYVAYHWCRLN